MYKFFILLVALQSCINKDITKVNDRSSTMQVLGGPWKSPEFYTGKDSCLLYVKMYKVQANSIIEYKYQKEVAKIESECFINGKKYNLEKNDLIELKVPGNKIIISANDIHGSVKPLQKRKLYLPKNGAYNINIYLLTN